MELLMFYVLHSIMIVTSQDALISHKPIIKIGYNSKEDHELEWLIDSACSLHMTGMLEYLCDFKAVTNGGHVTFGNDANITIQGYGVLTNGNFSIQRVTYVEGLKHNLISVGQFCKAGHRVEFDEEYSYIMTKDRSR
ncbi:uncharacterized protein LOC111904606 [Lactuca sativa]|uniref:uncharacterized protein LOC111904606 n=1 Tax=Lactuca sativa TaxID=4236 RepID=UPI000CD9D83C|nr:uncharacterized protein LOC111904606 [Lactuca sativa]